MGIDDERRSIGNTGMEVMDAWDEEISEASRHLYEAAATFIALMRARDMPPTLIASIIVSPLVSALAEDPA